MRLPAFLPALAIAGAAAATPYDGTYRPSRESDCSRVGEEGGALRIEDGLFVGIGSECRMTRPVDVVDMDATLYTMECNAGETRWTERAMLMQAAGDDGVIMLWNGYAFRYERCSPEEISGEVPTGGPAPEEPGALTSASPPRVLLPRVELPSITGIPAEGAAREAPAADTPDSAPGPDEAPGGGPDASGGTSASAADAGEAG